MKKISSFVLACLACMGLSACNDYSSPQAVVGSAYAALSKNDLKSFRKTLQGEALEQFGNAEGMALLQNEFQGEPTLGKTTFVSERDGTYGDYQTYNVEFFVRQEGSTAKVYDATVFCVVRQRVRRTGDPYADPFVETLNCKISDLKGLN